MVEADTVDHDYPREHPQVVREVEEMNDTVEEDYSCETSSSAEVLVVHAVHHLARYYCYKNHLEDY